MTPAMRAARTTGTSISISIFELFDEVEATGRGDADGEPESATVVGTGLGGGGGEGVLEGLLSWAEECDAFSEEDLAETGRVDEDEETTS
jgi:hypothetical protein